MGINFKNWKIFNCDFMKKIGFKNWELEISQEKCKKNEKLKLKKILD